MRDRQLRIVVFDQILAVVEEVRVASVEITLLHLRLRSAVLVLSDVVCNLAVSVDRRVVGMLAEGELTVVVGSVKFGESLEGAV